MIINSKYLKQYSPIPYNFDTTEVKNYIETAERIWVRPLIGTDLYDELTKQVEGNEVSQENATLLTTGGLWRYLSYAVTYEALPFLWTHISNVGITLGKSDNSDSVTLKDLTYVQSHLRSQVEVLKEQLIEWMDDHYESFPLYHPTNCNCTKCCTTQSSLKDPNPYKQLYSTNKKCTNIH